MTAPSITPNTKHNAIQVEKLLISSGGDVSTNLLEIAADNTVVFAVNNQGDITIGGAAADLTVGENVAITGTLAVTSTSTFTGGVTFNGGITMGDAKNIALNATTGTKIGTATTQKLGFYNATPVVQASAYTQTYSTADKTHAAPTAVALTVGTLTGTADGAMEVVGATNGGDVSGAIMNNEKELFTQINAAVADIADVKQLVNSVIDDLQALGLVG